MAYVGLAGNAVEAFSTGLPPMVSITAQSTVQSGAVLDGLCVRANAVISITTSAGVTGGVVALQGSLDNANWYALGSPTTTSTASTTTAVLVQNAYARFVRAAITTAIAGGGTVTCSVGVNG
jgi:hypothetical protein